MEQKIQSLKYVQGLVEVKNAPVKKQKPTVATIPVPSETVFEDGDASIPLISENLELVIKGFTVQEIGKEAVAAVRRGFGCKTAEDKLTAERWQDTYSRYLKIIERGHCKDAADEAAMSDMSWTLLLLEQVANADVLNVDEEELKSDEYTALAMAVNAVLNPEQEDVDDDPTAGTEDSKPAGNKTIQTMDGNVLIARLKVLVNNSRVLEQLYQLNSAHRTKQDELLAQLTATNTSELEGMTTQMSNLLEAGTSTPQPEPKKESLSI